MKKTITFLTLSLFFCLPIFSQNDFGTVGSHWRYNYIPHNGDGSGWTMIQVEKDTMINGAPFKKLKRTEYYDSIMDPPVISTYEMLMEIKNDSVFINNELVLDFNMTMTDSLYLTVQNITNIQLAVDSITTEVIEGNEYKKWHGQKICIDGSNGTGPYESFTILETVGQIADDYLVWNMDGCAIGGGLKQFTCYRNGDFTYPPGATCEALIGTHTFDLTSIQGLKIFPNPVHNWLNISLEDSEIEEVVIYNLDGKELFREKNNNYSNRINLEKLNFNSGMYLLKIQSGDKISINKFIKL